MSLPYDSGNFNAARPTGESYIEYPFEEEGDITTKVYHLICSIHKDSYTPLELNSNIAMTTAAAAGVSSLPFAADSAAYFIGDFGDQIEDGVLRIFDRQFSNIPIARSRPTGSTAFTFPGYFISGTPNEYKSEQAAVVGSVTDYTYYLPGVTPGITTVLDVDDTPLFAPVFTLSGNRATILRSNTEPTGTEYKASVAAKENLIAQSTITTWRGNIIQRANLKVRAI